MNEAESSKASAILRQAGYMPTMMEESADVIIVNSCVVRQAAEDKVAGKVGSLLRLKQQNPDLKIALTGCMVTGQQTTAALSAFHMSISFTDHRNLSDLVEIAPEIETVDVDLAELPHYYQDASTIRRDGLRADYLRLQFRLLLLHRAVSPRS